MKKFFALCLLFMFVLVSTTACTQKQSQKPNIIQSKRRFADYMESPKLNDPNAIDLSEGPKLKYDAKLGPKNPEFDIKIIDPYKY